MRHLLRTECMRSNQHPFSFIAKARKPFPQRNCQMFAQRFLFRFSFIRGYLMKGKVFEDSRRSLTYFSIHVDYRSSHSFSFSTTTKQCERDENEIRLSRFIANRRVSSLTMIAVERGENEPAHDLSYDASGNRHYDRDRPGSSMHYSLHHTTHAPSREDLKH